MKNTLLTIFLVSVLFCGCGNNPIFSMMPDVASSGGGGGGGGSSELDINMSTFITGDPAPTGTLTTTISAKPTIKWTDNTGKTDTQIRVTVLKTGSIGTTTYWQICFPNATSTSVVYGILPSGGTTLVALKSLTAGSYKVRVELGHNFSGVGPTPVVVTIGTGTLIIN